MSLKSGKSVHFLSVLITCHIPANVYRTVLQIDMHRKSLESRPVCLDFEWTHTFINI